MRKLRMVVILFVFMLIGGIFSANNVYAADTYTVNVLLVKNGTQITPSGEKTYSSNEEVTYTVSSAWDSGSNDHIEGFMVDGKFEAGVLNKDGNRTYTFPKGTTGMHEIYGVTSDEVKVKKIDVHAAQEYCHGVTISPAGFSEYNNNEEITYTIKGSGDIKPSYFVVNGKKVQGTLVDEYTMTYTFTEDMKQFDSIIYGIGEETPNSTYTIDVTLFPSNGINVSNTGVYTYSSEEETTYTIKSICEEIRPGYFVINGERVDGKVVDKQTLSYTFPKGTTGVYTLYGATEDFGDVNKEDWFYDDVTYVNGKGLMTGLEFGTFAPAASLARAQFMVILHRMEGEPKATFIPKSHWFDVVDDWYEDAIYWGFQHKIMTGYSESQYWGTGDNITREQLATVMYRYAEYKKYDTTKRAEIDQFEDAASVSDFAKDAVQWAVAEGIITGKDEGTKLDPQGDTARAECAAMIQRFIENYQS